MFSRFFFAMRTRAIAILASIAAFHSFAARAGEPVVVKTIRVLQLNIYGRDKKNCEERHRTIAKRVLEAKPTYEVVSLNEHWNFGLGLACDHNVLTDVLRAEPRFRDGGKDIVRSLRHFPKGGDFPQMDGGNSLFTPHRIAESHSNGWVNTRLDLASGYLLSRIDLGAGLLLDVWTVHLESASDGCDHDCRWEQITDFASAVTIMSEDNPVLVMGDFNVGGPMSAFEKPPYKGNSGYAEVMEEFKNPRDLWLEAAGGPLNLLFPGYTFDCKLNNLTKCGYRERIDYIFAPEAKSFTGKSPYKIRVKKIEVVRWKTPAGTDVSDHFGLDATLELTKP